MAKPLTPNIKQQINEKIEEAVNRNINDNKFDIKEDQLYIDSGDIGYQNFKRFLTSPDKDEVVTKSLRDINAMLDNKVQGVVVHTKK